MVRGRRCITPSLRKTTIFGRSNKPLGCVFVNFKIYPHHENPIGTIDWVIYDLLWQSRSDCRRNNVLLALPAGLLSDRIRTKVGFSVMSLVTTVAVMGEPP